MSSKCTKLLDESPNWSRRVLLILLDGYLRSLSPKHIGISLYCSICYQYFYDSFASFQLNGYIEFNRFSGNIRSSKIVSSAKYCNGYGISLKPWTKLSFDNNMKTFIHKFEMRSIGYNLSFCIGVIPLKKTHYKYNSISPYLENDAYWIRLYQRAPGRSWDNYKWGASRVYYKQLSKSQQLADTTEDWSRNGHKLGIIINCNEWKLYMYYDDEIIRSYQLDDNMIYYPRFTIYIPCNKIENDRYRVITYCTDLVDTLNVYNSYILKECPRKSDRIELNLFDIDKPKKLFDVLWKGYMFIDLNKYNGKIENLMDLIKPGQFSYNCWYYHYNEYKQIKNHRDALQLWIIIELFQYFRHNIYIKLIGESITNNNLSDNLILVECITYIITDYCLQNIDNEYNEYFGNDDNLEWLALNYCTMSLHINNYKKIAINEQLIYWMDNNVIPYIPSKYLLAIKGEKIINYMTNQKIDFEHVMEEDISKTLLFDLEDAYDDKLGNQYDKEWEEWHDNDYWYYWKDHYVEDIHIGKIKNGFSDETRAKLLNKLEYGNYGKWLRKKEKQEKHDKYVAFCNMECEESKEFAFNSGS